MPLPWRRACHAEGGGGGGIADAQDPPRAAIYKHIHKIHHQVRAFGPTGVWRWRGVMGWEGKGRDVGQTR
jgi:hypothetical protein